MQQRAFKANNNMLRQVVVILLITTVLVFVMFRPFMPGHYDMLAVPLSFATQVVSFVMLIFVPIGIFRWVSAATLKSEARRTHLLTVVLAACAMTSIVFSLALFLQDNATLGAIGLIASLSTIAIVFKKYLRSPSAGPNDKSTPYYLVVIPAVIFLARFLWLDDAVAFSQRRAIRNAHELIEKIEAHFVKYGRYPQSIQALRNDIVPGIVGIPQFHYEPNGQAYNLYFKQFTGELDVDVIVMYNKLGEHRFAAHSLDVLEYTGEELALRRGDRRRVALDTPNWISIKFD